jgi:hypothetical protein
VIFVSIFLSRPNNVASDELAPSSNGADALTNCDYHTSELVSSLWTSPKRLGRMLQEQLDAMKVMDEWIDLNLGHQEIQTLLDRYSRDHLFLVEMSDKEAQGGGCVR